VHNTVERIRRVVLKAFFHNLATLNLRIHVRVIVEFVVPDDLAALDKAHQRVAY